MKLELTHSKKTTLCQEFETRLLNVAKIVILHLSLIMLEQNRQLKEASGEGWLI